MELQNATVKELIELFEHCKVLLKDAGEQVIKTKNREKIKKILTKNNAMCGLCGMVSSLPGYNCYVKYEGQSISQDIALAFHNKYRWEIVTALCGANVHPVFREVISIPFSGPGYFVEHPNATLYNVWKPTERQQRILISLYLRYKFCDIIIRQLKSL